MFWRFFSFLLLLHVVLGQTTIENFLPFGTIYGDATMLRPLDSVTGPIRINVHFPFFGKWYDVIRVYSHGLILFGNVTYQLPHQPPGRFPLLNFVCAAPYWADTDISQDPSSNIFYREIIDDATLVQISSMVRNGFPLLSAHRMLWAYVVTWHRVPGHTSNPGRNTYQAIITTNGIYSFALYTYNQLQWSAGAWGGHPQVGFNAGDQVNFFTLEKSFSADISSITQDSNIGVPGQFIFLTNGNISDVQCNTTQGLQSSPFRGSMHGGYPLRLFGICFPDSSYIVDINGRELNDCRVTTVSITCTMPMVFEGRLQIKLLNTGKQVVGQTEFLSFLPETNAELILNNHGDLINKPRLIEDRRLQLHFAQNALTTNYLFRIVIYDYGTQYMANNNTFYNIITRRVDLDLGALNLSVLNNLTINFQSVFPITGVPNDQVHLLDISFELIPPNTTTKETFSWKGTQQFTTRTFIVPYALFSSYCPTWLALQSDIHTRNLTSHTPGCPCRVRTTWDEEQFGFTTDPVCNARKSGPWNCQYQRGAKGCYQRKSTTSDGGAHCCYDTGGTMITDVRRGGGSIKSHYPETSKALSTYQHFFSDFLSYFSCCGISTEILGTCAQYMRYRPSGTCVNFIPVPVVGRGDPHFSTLDGNSYTFNGHGEYSLLKSVDERFEIQVRLARLVNESTNAGLTSSMDNATAILAFIIHNEDQPRVQFELFPKLRLLEIRVDEKLLEFTPLSEQDELLSSSLIYFDDRQLIIRQRDANSYSISYGENGIQFIVYLRPQFDFLDFVSIVPSTFKEKSKFQGILGGFEGLAYANGTNVSTNLSDDQALFTYGESWRTTSNSSLFYYRFQDSHAEHQDLTYRPIFQHELFQKYLNTSRYQMAEDVCRHMTHVRECIYDVLITNDATVGQMHEKYETNIQVLNEYIELVTIDIENSETTTSTGTTPSSETTPKPQNAAVKYFVNEIWMIVLCALLMVCH